MKNRKKLTALLLTAAMVICLIPSAVWADDNRAQLPPVMTAYEGTTLGESEENDEQACEYEDEGNNEDYGISLLSLFEPAKTITKTVILDRSAGLPAGIPTDSPCSFHADEVLTEVIEENREYLLENGFITESGKFSNNSNVMYAYDSNFDKPEFTAWDGIITPNPSYNSSTGTKYIHIYFSSSDDQLNTDYVLFHLTVHFKLYDEGKTINAVIDRTNGIPDGFADKSKNFYVREVLKDYLAENNMLNASGEYDGNIAYEAALYARGNFTNVGWNDVISNSSNPSYYFLLGGNGLYSGTRYRVNIEYKFPDNEFASKLKFELYNQSGTKLNINSTSRTNSTDYTSVSSYISERSLGENEKPRFLVSLPDGYSTGNVEVYEGYFSDEAALVSAVNITSKVVNTTASYDMDIYGAHSFEKKMTFVTTNTDGSKLLSRVCYSVNMSSNSISLYTSNISGSGKYTYLYDAPDGGSYIGYVKVWDKIGFDDISVQARVTYTDNYDKTGSALSKIDFACFGLYTSKEAAINAGAEDIKDQLFVNSTSNGPVVDFSKCRSITAYNEDGAQAEIKYIDVTILDIYGNIFTDTDKIAVGHIPGNETTFTLKGVKLDSDEVDSEGNNKKESLRNIYSVNGSNDDYYENGYQTIFMLDNSNSSIANGTAIYPVFTCSDGALVNAEGIEGYQTSEISPIIFESGKAIQYSVGSENGKNRSNYWVTFVTQQKGPKLFVNAANYQGHFNANGNPQREVFIDSKHKDHEILIANIGDEALENLSVKLSDNTHGITLDEYWTILDNSVKTIDPFTNGKTPGVIKIRILPIDENKFCVISGTLTVQAERNDPVNIEITGIAGEPKITTDSIFDGVKYVPYSCVIMTNSMYDTDVFSFKTVSGRLPKGISLKENGELYGIPMEKGTFSFTVEAKYVRQLNDGTNKEYTAERSYTLVIKDNTDTNVDAVNEDGQGYALIDKISREITVHYSLENNGVPVIDSIEAESNSFRSKGEFTDFLDLYLDGEKLDKRNYSAESGSTKITVDKQTFGGVVIGNKDVSHTLAAEFRTEGGTKDLKRSAQNITLNYVKADDENNQDDNSQDNNSQDNNNQNNNSTSGGNSGSTNSGSTAEAGSVTVNMTVTDKYGNALPGLNLELHSTPKYASTDSSGQASFDTVEFGRHTLYVTNPDTGKKTSLSFTVKQGKKTQIDGKVITAAPGDKVNMTVEYNGKSLAMSSSMTDISAGAGISDDGKAAETNSFDIVVFYIALLFPFTALVLFAVRKKINK